MTDNRWPARVYADGEEPDYRFSLANERTFLAWVRTSLALIAAGVALDVLNLGLGQVLSKGLSVLLLGMGALTPAIAWWRWAQAERALRHSKPLPPVGAVAAVLVLVLLLTAVALVVMMATR